MTKDNQPKVFDENGNPISREDWNKIFDELTSDQNETTDQAEETSKPSHEETIAQKKAEAKKKFDEFMTQAKTEIPGVKKHVKKTSDKVKDAGLTAVAVTVTVVKSFKKQKK